MALPATSIRGLGCTNPCLAKREPRPAIGTRMLTFMGGIAARAAVCGRCGAALCAKGRHIASASRCSACAPSARRQPPHARRAGGCARRVGGPARRTVHQAWRRLREHRRAGAAAALRRRRDELAGVAHCCTSTEGRGRRAGCFGDCETCETESSARAHSTRAASPSRLLHSCNAAATRAPALQLACFVAQSPAGRWLGLACCLCAARDCCAAARVRCLRCSRAPHARAHPVRLLARDAMGMPALHVARR
jgi:hypothetical protein